MKSDDIVRALLALTTLPEDDQANVLLDARNRLSRGDFLPVIQG